MSCEPSTSFREFLFGSMEYEAAWALREAVLRVPLGLTLSSEDLSAERRQRHFGLFSAEGPMLACCIAAAQERPHEVRIRQMVVSPGWQRAGIGRQLMRAVECALAKDGCRTIVLHARLVAVDFYLRLGYSVEGDEFMEVNIPHRHMRKDLAAHSKM